MIRFRVGQSWKREAPDDEGPRDAFALELDGVNLLPGVIDEPLNEVMAELVEAVGAVVGGERAGQLSLPGVQVEVCLWRRPGTELELSVIDLGQPPARLGQVVVEAADFAAAALRSARTFLEEARQHRRTVDPRLTALEARLGEVEHTVLRGVAPEDAGGWGVSRPGSAGLGFALSDAAGRTLRWTRRGRAALPPLLFEGRVCLPGGEAVEGLPFLTLMGLARDAGREAAALGGRPLEPRAVFEACVEACAALRQRNAAFSANPYVEALEVRCVEGLKALRQPVPDVVEHPSPPRRERADAPLPTAGALRRLSLSPRWAVPVALGEEAGGLLLGKGLVVATSAHAAHAFSPAGAVRFRHLANRGVAVSARGEVLCATEHRLTAHRGGGGARWFRDHDGVRIGPRLLEVGGVRVTLLAGRGAMGVDALTGRERWRFDPPRTQRSFLSSLGHRVLLASDSGSLWGIDAADGQVRFRVRAGLPCVAAAVGTGSRALAVLSRADHTAVFACDALAPGGAVPAGAVAWTCEFTLSAPCAPVATRTRAFVGGTRDGQGTVVCLSARGQKLWERAVPCDGRTLSLAPFGGGVLAADARGACARLLADGELDWALGSSGDELAHRVPLKVSRQVVVVPGPVLRVVEPVGGRVLTELDAGARLADVAVDRRLTLYLYKEPGQLEAWALGTLLSVVR